MPNGEPMQPAALRAADMLGDQKFQEYVLREHPHLTIDTLHTIPMKELVACSLKYLGC